ncbi:MAG: hypothetical protein RX318_12200 [bacterium]|nr:hypothetical protein [bacterium]
MAPPTSDDEGMTAEERKLLDEVVENEESAVQQADEAVATVDADRTAREAEPYPPTTLKLDKPAPFPEPAPPEVDEQEGDEQKGDEFALPSADATPKVDGTTADDISEVTAEPYAGSIPSMVITAELQKAMLRSRIIIQHTFESLELEHSNMLRYLQEEKPEMYADIVVRVAAMHFICWQKAMGL